MRARFGIFWKYFMAYSATATVVILVLAVLMNAAIKNRYRDIIVDDLRKYSVFAGEAFKTAFEDEPVSIQETVKLLGERTEARITLILPDGEVLADSEEDPARMENHAERPEIRTALSGQEGLSVRYSTTLRERMAYMAVPVFRSGSVAGVVRVSLKVRAIEFLIREHTREIFIISVVVWVITLVLTFLFSSMFSASVKHMVDLTKRLASGDFSRRAIVRRQDELGELATGLNEMSQKLQSSFDELRSQHDELDAIIDSMTEAVLVLDDKTHIAHTNSSFERIFSIQGDAIGRSYMEVVRSVALKEMIDELMKAGRMTGRRLKFNGRTLIINGVVLTNDSKVKHRAVLVFHDITLDAQLEDVKAEFVANASHELRTPLTAIRGYLETFEDEDAENQRNFTRIIQRNVERMSSLVSDLLLLSRLESSTPQVNMEKTEILNIVEDVVKLVERSAEDKGLALKVEVPPELVVNGDPFLLEQVLLNLLDNAVKYTEKGEIALQAGRKGDRIEVRVSDTGVGIQDKHLPRIFERFYRVDKARSRALGGTGLGLSIVKHIIQIHGGDIQVESRVGSGTTFTIHLPAG